MRTYRCSKLGLLSLKPSHSYFELDAPFRLTVIGPKETEQVVVVNNGNWTNLVPKMVRIYDSVMSFVVYFVCTR